MKKRTAGIPYISHGFKEDTNFQCVPGLFSTFPIKIID